MALLAWCLGVFICDKEQLELCTAHPKDKTGSVL